jgi:hypothetical protein
LTISDEIRCGGPLPPPPNYFLDAPRRQISIEAFVYTRPIHVPLTARHGGVSFRQFVHICRSDRGRDGRPKSPGTPHEMPVPISRIGEISDPPIVPTHSPHPPPHPSLTPTILLTKPEMQGDGRRRRRVTIGFSLTSPTSPIWRPPTSRRPVSRTARRRPGAFPR